MNIKEELRGQLAERIPNAVGALANALGKTVPELNKLMEAGKLSTKEVMLMAKELRRLAKDSGALDRSMTTLSAHWGRFTNTLKVAFSTSKDGSDDLTASLKDVLKEMTALVNKVMELSTGGFSRALGSVIRFFTQMFGLVSDLTLGLMGMQSGASVFDEIAHAVNSMNLAIIKARQLILDLKKQFGLLKPPAEQVSQGSAGFMQQLNSSLGLNAIPLIGPALASFDIAKNLRPRIMNAFASGGTTAGVTNNYVEMSQSNSVTGVIPDEMVNTMKTMTEDALSATFEASLSTAGGN